MLRYIWQIKTALALAGLVAAVYHFPRVSNLYEQLVIGAWQQHLGQFLISQHVRAEFGAPVKLHEIVNSLIEIILINNWHVILSKKALEVVLGYAIDSPSLPSVLFLLICYVITDHRHTKLR